jgi:type II secretory pathway pseudopilin PulG
MSGWMFARSRSRSRVRVRGRGRSRGRGISLVDVLVVIVLVGLLVALWAPVVSEARGKSVRYRCANHLQIIFNALQNYRNANGGASPRTIYVPGAKPDVSSAGAAATDPFKAGGPPPNNVPAAFFLLLRTQDTHPRHFICPAGDFEPDPTGGIDPSRRSNFTDVKKNLGYSFKYTYGTETPPQGRAQRQPWMVVAADLSPGLQGDGDDQAVKPEDPPARMRRANSNNHRKAGQVVLFEGGYTDFRATPFIGGGDNIYATDKGSVTEAPEEGDTLLLPSDD